MLMVPQVKPDYLVDELGLALVGNSDLKRRLLLDPSFLEWLEEQVSVAADSVTAASSFPDPATLHDPSSCPWRYFQKTTTILRLLAKPAEEFSDQPSPTPPGRTLAGCMAPLLRVVSHFSTVCNSLDAASAVAPGKAHSDSSKAAWTLAAAVLADIVHVLLVIAEASHNFDTEPFWEFLAKILAWPCSPSTGTATTLTPVVSQALALIPVLLEQNEPSAARHVPGFIEATLKAHDLIAKTICEYLFGKSQASATLAPDINMEFLQDLMVATAQTVNFARDHSDAEKFLSSRFTSRFSSKDFVQCLVFSINAEGYPSLNVAALNLLHLMPDMASQDLPGTLEKLFPRIIELIELESSAAGSTPKFVQNPVALLADLCLSYLSVCSLLRNTNVDYKLMSDLSEIFRKSAVLYQLQKLKQNMKKENKFVDFSNIRSGFTTLQVISSYLLLLSIYTSSNEDYRRRITSFKDKETKHNFLGLMIFELIENYHFMTKQLLHNYALLQKAQSSSSNKATGQIIPWLATNIGILTVLLEHPIYTNVFYLTRALSRSVMTLRTFFVDCNSVKSSIGFLGESNVDGQLASKTADNIIDLACLRYDRDASFENKGNLIHCLLDLFSRIENIGHVLLSFAKTNKNSGHKVQQTRRDICVKKVVILASIANFILDFSSFRYEIVNHETFLQDLADSFQRPITNQQIGDSFSGKDDENQLNKEIVHEQLRVQIGVLQVIKNYLYNENEENRKFVWDYIPMSLIFEKSLYGIMTPPEDDDELHKLQIQQKVVAFEIMRNLTAASAYFSGSINDFYGDYVRDHCGDNRITSWNDYLLENLLSFDLFMDVHNSSTRDFFVDDEFTLSLIKNLDYVRMVVAINYLEDHRYTNTPVFKRENFPKSNLLEVWKRFLSVSLSDDKEAKLCSDMSQRVRLANHLSELKISISWLLINLTWKDDDVGYQMPDKSNFSILDTVSSHADSSLFNASYIVFEESDESETEEPPKLSSTGVFTAEECAKQLYKHGFSHVLQELINEMSAVSSHRRDHIGLERFDHLNSNDLYEKSKTAHFQIMSLVSGSKEGRARQRPSDRHPLRRLSNISGSHDPPQPRRDVNRGGEGFGYGLDDNYIAEDAAPVAPGGGNEPQNRDALSDEFDWFLPM